MKFAEKLKALTTGENKSLIARKGGLSATAISDYLQKGYIPRADKALMLARGLGVPLEWLLDDDQDMPAPNVEKQSAAALPDQDLMREVCRRYRLEVLRLRSAIQSIETIDWSHVANLLVPTPFDADVPPEIAREVRLIDNLRAAVLGLHRYDPDYASQEFLRELPGSEIPWKEIKANRLRQQAATLNERLPSYGAAWGYVLTRSHRHEVGATEDRPDMRESLMREVDEVSGPSDPAAAAAWIDKNKRRALNSPRSLTGPKRKA